MRTIYTDEPIPASRTVGLWAYNGLDCCVTLEVLEALLPQLDSVSSRTYDFSRALQAPVLEMMRRGLLVDQWRRDEVLGRLRGVMRLVEDQLDEIVREGIGTEVNWRSPVQLNRLFYSVLNLAPVHKRDKATGKMRPTSDRAALEKLSGYMIAEPLCTRIMLLKDLDKERQFLETGIDPDGRMRTNFNIAGTVTGRLASAMSDFGTGTNMQNVNADLRSVFVSDPGMKFAEFDLEQADARNVGAVCWNLFLKSHGPAYAGAYLDACESGDVHSAVSRLVWPEVDPTEPFYRGQSHRQVCKKLGHASNYLVGLKTAEAQTKIPRKLIENFHNKYFDRFRCLPSWHEAVAKQLRATSTITSLMGRRRYFYGRRDDAKTIRDAVAYDPQSSTADEIDTGILRLFAANRVQLMLQVHDSVLIQYPEEQEDSVVNWGRDALRVELTLAEGRSYHVPVDAKVGWNWGPASSTNPNGLVKWTATGDGRKKVA